MFGLLLFVFLMRKIDWCWKDRWSTKGPREQGCAIISGIRKLSISVIENVWNLEVALEKKYTLVALILRNVRHGLQGT